MSVATSSVVPAATIKQRVSERVFLTAQWRALAMLNWKVPAEILEPYVPRGTELDFHQGETYVSIVGFMFLDTRLLGLPIPFHRNFEEVNLRFYLRREVGGEVFRGVAFIREIVPRWAVSTVARLAYNEQYVSLPMKSQQTNYLLDKATSEQSDPHVEYAWRHRGTWCGIQMQCAGERRPLSPSSGEEFIAEHYWGYSRQRDGSTKEFRVEHPAWEHWPAVNSSLIGPVPEFYAPEFAETLSRAPDSAFLADGSAVKVYQPRRIE
ncbi:MAG: YqjF family protein [Pirellulaceae bacterium]